jgi:hypothetical protein
VQMSRGRGHRCPDEQVLPGDEGAAPDRLGAERATLPAQGEQAPTSGDGRVDAADAGMAGRQCWRTILAVVLIVLGCVLAPLGGVAVWARNQVTNTDRCWLWW